jgi:hypothetical protein
MPGQNFRCPGIVLRVGCCARPVDAVHNLAGPGQTRDSFHTSLILRIPFPTRILPATLWRTTKIRSFPLIQSAYGYGWIFFYF